MIPRRKSVQLQQQNEHRWELDTTFDRIVATNCLKLVTTKLPEALVDGGEDNRNLICANCYAVFHLHEFKNAINISTPKYNNKKYWNESAGHMYLTCKGSRELIESKASPK